MRCWQVALLPQSSVAVHVRMITFGQPSSVTLSAYVTARDLSQLSVAVAVPVLLGSVLQPAAPQARMVFGGQVITGFVASLTVITCVQLTVLPHRSRADQVRVMTLLQDEPGLLWVSLR